jgi:hypothetical protein
VEIAVDVATRTIDEGGSNWSAALGAYGALGLMPPPGLVAAVDGERFRLGSLVAELDALGSVESTEELRAVINRRLDVTERVLAVAMRPLATPPPRPPIGGVQTEVDLGRPDSDDDDGARILGATGAFLLVAATILFEAFGMSSGGTLRLAVVVGLQALLAAGTATCFRYHRMRPVAPIYLATTVLLFPLTLAAAAVFLRLGENGLSVPAGLAAGGAACAVLYGITALALRSSAYGFLAAAALTTCGVSGAIAALPAAWVPLGLVALTASFVALDLASASAPGRRVAATFGLWAPIFALGVALAGAIWAEGEAAKGCAERFPISSCNALEPAPEVHGLILALTLAGTCAIMAIGGFRPIRRWWLGPAALSGGLAVLVANWSLSGGPAGASVELAVMAIGLALGADRMPEVARWWRALAVVGALFVAACVRGPSWWAPIMLMFAAYVPSHLARKTDRGALMIPSLLLATMAGGFALWTLAPKTAPLSSLRAAVWLSPFTALLTLYGIRVGRRRGKGWSTAAYSAAALVAATDVVIAAAGHHPLVVGVLLVVDGLLLEVVTVADQRRDLAPWVAALSGVGALVAVAWSGAPAALLPLAGLAVGLFSWVMGALIDGPNVSLHRKVGLAVGVLATLWALAGMGSPTLPGVEGLVSLTATSTTAAMLAADRRWFEGPWWRGYAVGFVLSFGGLALARMAGAVDAQWYVLGPGVATFTIGLRLPVDDRAPDRVNVGRVIAALGLLLLFGTTLLQVPQVADPASRVAFLIGEGVVSVVLGVFLCRRVPVIGGAAAVAAGGLIALSRSGSSVTLFVVAATLALGLLTAAALRLTRRSAEARAAAPGHRPWRGWL